MSPVRPGIERMEQPQVGSPSALFEETEVKSLVRSPRDARMDVRIACLKYEREKEEREFHLKCEIALKRIEAEAVTAREVAFKKIEADAALRMRQLELQSAGRSPVSSSPVSWSKAHSANVSPAHVVGAFPVAARDQSPIDGVESIMWSDSAGGKVCPMSVLTHAQSERGVGAPSCGRPDDTTVYIEKPELLTSVSPPPTDKAGQKFSLAGLVPQHPGFPGPDVRPGSTAAAGALLTVDYTVRISTGVERTMLCLRPLGVTGDLHHHLGGGGGTHMLSHFVN
uniref:Uncharacterized protein n=1 Tax=Knipowitschia caucasica TaxID=637954 RepID=A0AAV2J7Z3_KNICA